jgi:homocysteine S-methyltransferase
LAVLANSGIDLFACETMPDILEIDTLRTLLNQYPEIPAWFTVTMKDPSHLSDGTALKEFQERMEQSPTVFAYGVNCLKPEWVEEVIAQLAECHSKPFVVYPNSGETYDATSKTWTHSGNHAQWFSTEAVGWNQMGAQLIGGCCCTSVPEIQQLVKQFSKK